MADNAALTSELCVLQGHSNPQDFLEVRQDFSKHYSKSMRALHDYFHSNVGRSGLGVFGPLSELYVDGFDDEQVWEEIQLTNEPFFKFLNQRVRTMATWRVPLCEVIPEGDRNDRDDGCGDTLKEESLATGRGNKMVQFVEEVEEDEEEVSDIEESSDLEGSYFDDEEESPLHGNIMPSKKRGSAVDDRFFKLAEMHKFLDNEDMKEGAASNSRYSNHNADSDENSDDGINYFEDLPPNERGPEMHYADFFDPPSDDILHHSNEYDYGTGANRVEEDDDEASIQSDSEMGMELERRSKLEMDEESEEGQSDGEDEEEEDVAGILSSHEERLARMKKRVKAIEEHNIADKPWQLLGEISDRLRPENSLLQDHLDFEHTSQPAPVITEEVTRDLEDVIKQRIKDESWDDVERKLKPREKPYNYRVTRPLDQEKSSKSLAEVYEEEYLKETTANGMKEGGGEWEEVGENEKHVEIRKAMQRLFAKLDALSNFHFTPKPLKDEIRVVTNVPVISMEEVTPIAVNDRELLAPQELEEKDKAFAIGKGERSLTDKKRARRQWKRRAHFMSLRRSQKEALIHKLHPGTGSKASMKLPLKPLDKARNVTVGAQKQNEHKRIVKTSTQMFAELQEKTESRAGTLQRQMRSSGSSKRKPSVALKL